MRIDKNTTIKLGDRNIVKIKIGDSVIWQKSTEPVVEPDYFYIESLGDGNTISVVNQGDGSTTNVTPTLEYSKDKNTWNTITFDWASGEHTTELPVKLNTGEKMYFRNDTRKFSNSDSKYITFSSTVSSNVGGDIRTLSNFLDVDNETKPQTYMFKNLFYNNKFIVDASNLRLSYTTLAEGCYQSMFNGCTSLTTTPALPATTLAGFCYQYMFNGCSKLTSAPELPATTLSGYCYYCMFSGCTSLTTAPALIANTIVNGCYDRIFSNCSSLNKILVCAKSGTTSGNTNDWLYHVAASGTFYNAGSITYEQNSNSGIPTGWTEVSVVHTSVYAVPDTFSAKSWQDKNRCDFTLMSRNASGIDFPIGKMSELITIGKNTGSSTVTHTETLTYDGLDYTITINQTANDTDEPDYLYIESLGDGNTISVKNYGNGNTTNVTPTLEYSKDKNTWNTITFDWTSGEHTTELPIKLNTGEKMYFRNDTRKFSNSDSKYITFSSTVSSNVGGDIRTLSNYLDVNNETKTQEYMFYNLFKNNKYIVDASNLRLPYTTLADYCYSFMFSGCTSLTTTPALPATTLASSCYFRMFENCTSLTSAPELPATSLETSCYRYMFKGCTSLTTAPTLPATTLVYNCYGYMFQGCTSLTSAPELPATSLESYCYQYMFQDCTSLTSAPALPATNLASYCYSSMFLGCTSLTTAPALPATTLADYCYQFMFSGCTKLTTAPTLPATTLAMYCYDEMFRGCTSLTSVTIYAPDTYYRSFDSWLSGVASSGTVYNNGLVDLPKNSASGVPTGWSEIVPPIQSITANPDTFTIEFNNETVTCKSTLEVVTTMGTFTKTNSVTFTVGENTGSTTRTITETIPYYNSSYDVTIVQSAIQSITANPDTFTIKSYKDTVKCTSTLTITTTLGTTVTDTNTVTITVGENTGDSTRTLTETIPYKGSSYQVTIVQTANDVKPAYEWNVESTGTYPFELNTNGYYESTNKGHDNSYSYATLNYEGFENLVLECINFAESKFDYGIISQPDVQLSESIEDDGATGSTNVFHNFKGEQSANPVQITIPSDGGSHFITIKFRKDSSQSQDNDSLQFKVIEP